MIIDFLFLVLKIALFIIVLAVATFVAITTIALIWFGIQNQNPIGFLALVGFLLTCLLVATLSVITEL